MYESKSAKMQQQGRAGQGMAGKQAGWLVVGCLFNSPLCHYSPFEDW